jgi:hypothetical protein
MSPPSIAFDKAEVSIPAQWSEAKRSDDRAVFRSPDGHQQAVISVMRFGTDPSFDDFIKLCSHRIESERAELADGFVQPDKPFQEAGRFGMFYSGGDKKTGRVFSGYLSLAHRQLIIIYIEGVGIAPADHLKTFQEWVRGLHGQ